MTDGHVEAVAQTPSALIGVAMHVMTCVTTATTLAVVHGAISVYLLDKVDSKFGAAGTLQLYGLIALMCSSVAAASAGLSHFFWLRKSARRRFALSLGTGAAIGVVLAMIHKPLLFNMPIVPGLSDWPQYCVYFLVLGYVLHAMLVGLINKVGTKE